MAASRMLREPAGHTLQATALVHEVWLRLEGNGECFWENRAHFWAAASQAMRRILVDRARRKAAHKRRAGDCQAQETGREPEDYILAVHESLAQLEKDDPEAARIVLLKYFCGLGSMEIARVTDSSVRSVERHWALAKAKLYQIIRRERYCHDFPFR